MAKNIQWKKSELDYDALNKLTPQYLGSSKGGKTSMVKLLEREERSEWCAMGGAVGGKISGRNNVESGQILDFIEGGQKARDEYWATVTPEKKEDHISKLHEGLHRYSDEQRAKHLKAFADVPTEFNRNDLKIVGKQYNFSTLHQLILRYYKDIWFTKIGHGKYKKI